jgi:cell division protein FtsL
MQQLGQRKAEFQASIAQFQTKIAEIESQLDSINKAQSNLDVQVVQLQKEGKDSYERFNQLLLLQ